MAYRLRYSWNIDWIGPGMGPSGSPMLGQGGGNAQTLGGINQAGAQNTAGSGAHGVLAAADITAVTNAMAADVAAQLNLAPNLAITGGWVTGQP